MELFNSYRIDKNSYVSIYIQLKQLLKNLILEKQFKPDEKIPSENELGRHFSISRMTVRQAIKELIAEGYLYIRRGEGTFVCRVEKIQQLIKLDGFSREMTRLGYKPSSRILLAKKLDDYDSFREAYYSLGKGKHDFVVLIRRVLFLDNTPYALENSYLDAKIGEPLLGRTFKPEFSIYRYIEDECGIVLAKANHIIEPVLVDKATADLLEIKKGEPVLRLKGTTYTRDGVPTEYLESVYRGGKYQLNIEIKK